MITTIKLDKETKERLEKLREHKRESYDELIRKILYVLSLAKTEPEKARITLSRIDENRERMIKEAKEKK
jgi:predicted transcriptional regulator